VFAETQTVDSLLAGGGIGGITAISLFGGFLYWFTRSFLPAKDAQVEKLIASRDQAMAAKDAQITDLIASRDAMMKALVDTNDKRIAELTTMAQSTEKERRADCQQSLQSVINYAQKENANVLEVVQRGFLELKQLQLRSQNKKEDS
jgi:hypothetical protein